MIAAALGPAARVRAHDDNSEPAMHDLLIEYSDGRLGAVEITSSVDAALVELWNLVNGGDGCWVVDGITGGWLASLRPEARVSRLRQELPALLRALESQSIRHVHTEWSTVLDPPEVHLADQLGIHQLNQNPTQYPGRVYFTVDLPTERFGGAAPDDGDALAAWVEEFLGAPARAGDLAKLGSARADERHAFVFIGGLSDAPWPVQYMALSDPMPLPRPAPILPKPVTDVWLASTWSTSTGVRWSSEDSRWHSFDKLQPSHP